MKPSTIVLLTDFGLKDAYAGLLKAVITSINPQVRVLELTHGIEPMNILHGACVLKDSYRFYPRGSIFVCVVDPGVGTARKILCVRKDGYYFIGPDNGLLSLAVSGAASIRSVENSRYFLKHLSSTFHGRDIMAPSAAYLSLNAKVFERLGAALASLKALPVPAVVKQKKLLKGAVLYFDHYGNAITNIIKTDAAISFWQSAGVSIKGKKLGGLRKSYGAGKAVLCAVFNSFSRLEIALPGGSAHRKYRLKSGDPVVVSI